MEIYKDLSSPASQQFEKLLNNQLSKNKIVEGKVIEGKITKINLTSQNNISFNTYFLSLLSFQLFKKI